MPKQVQAATRRNFRPYESICAAYHSPERYAADSEQAMMLTSLFATNPATGRVLGTNDVLVLLKNIMQGKANSCCKLNNDKLLTASEGKLTAFFPAGHRAVECNLLIKQWSHWTVMPWNQPLDKIRGYLGERIALYFAFLGWLCTTLLVPAAFGLVVFAIQVKAGDPWLVLASSLRACRHGVGHVPHRVLGQQAEVSGSAVGHF
jgi:hypothetical protein